MHPDKDVVQGRSWPDFVVPSLKICPPPIASPKFCRSTGTFDGIEGKFVNDILLSNNAKQIAL
jgi:hypothetical protein